MIRVEISDKVDSLDKAYSSVTSIEFLLKMLYVKLMY